VALWPTPRYVSGRPDGFGLPGTVGLVTAADTDGAALRAVRAVLEKAGVTDVRETAADPRTEVAFWLSGGAPVLRGLGASLTSGTTAEVRASAPGGATATLVRYRATAAGGGRCVVREFQ
jgi:hypothetical protein